MQTTASFGYWVRQQREALDLTQQVLAERVGCSLTAIKKIENEERLPSRQIAERLADNLGVPANQRELFLKYARGVQPLHQISLSHEPTETSMLPTGIVTFLFTDIEDSTKLWESAPEKMKVALPARHHAILQEAIAANGGTVFQIIGDAFCAAFATVPSAISAAVTAQRKLYQEQWDLPFAIRVRMGIHTGEAERTSNHALTGGYASNQTLIRVARILSAGHGGQVLLSLATKELLKDSLPANTELRDMGEHHLKNLVRPEHIFQLIVKGLPSDFPPLNTLDSIRHNLPIQLTSFIGREKEMAEIMNLLEQARMVTLIGPGGTGKTRLSIQVGSKLLNQYPDGVWLVELAPILDPLLVPRTTAIAIGLRDEPQRPVVDMLCDYLYNKKMFIVLDNCEHLVDACAQLADKILHATPHVNILASSREALGIGGETIYLVRSLQLPDLQNPLTVESLSQSESVRLFTERALAKLPNFTLTNENASFIAQICNRLDGMPLAIELAAGKIRALSAQQIAQRLDDRFRLLTGGSRTALPRHQTLQAVIEWSCNLLTPSEQCLFRRLSVFVNGWTLEAAESVCSHEHTTTKAVLKPEDILELLTQLVNKSLVMTEEVHGEFRYHMLETIRQFGSDKLVEANESEALRDRHLEYFLQWAESAEPHLIRAEQLEWLARLDVDHENLRAALEWSLSQESPESSLRLCVALRMFWFIRSYWMEGSQWLKRVLSKKTKSPTIAEKVALVKALYQDAELAQNLDDLERMKASAELSLALAREGFDRRDIAIARLYVGTSLRRQGADENARQLIMESLAEFQEIEDPYWEVFSYNVLNLIRIGQDDLRLSEEGIFMQALEFARKVGERSNLAEALLNYSRWLLIFNRVNDAQKYTKEVDSLLKQVGSSLGSTSQMFAQIASLNNDYQEARWFYIEAQARFGLLGEKNQRSSVLEDLGHLEMDQGNLDQALIALHI